MVLTPWPGVTIHRSAPGLSRELCMRLCAFGGLCWGRNSCRSTWKRQGLLWMHGLSQVLILGGFVFVVPELRLILVMVTVSLSSHGESPVTRAFAVDTTPFPVRTGSSARSTYLPEDTQLAIPSQVCHLQSLCLSPLHHPVPPSRSSPWGLAHFPYLDLQISCIMVRIRL